MDMTFGVGVGFAAFLGHVYTPWLGFKGGRGVATWFGIQPFVLGWNMLIPLVVFFGVAVPTRVVALASVLSAFGFLIAVLLTPSLMRSATAFILCLLMTAIIGFRHRANLRRLLEGKERGL